MKARSIITRRQALGLVAITVGAGASTAVVPVRAAQSPASSLALFADGAGVCSITPEVTEGPFHFDTALDRSDVTEGRDGLPLRVRMQVVDAACVPLAGLKAEIWHCDAQGLYSGYPRQGDGRDVDTSGETFLRGWQTTDEQGIVGFQTIYPGWYRGRTTHIHFKVHRGDGTVMTGQMFFPDAVSNHIYATLAAYRRGDERDTDNGRDGIAREAGSQSQAAVREMPDALEALLIVAVAG